MSLISKTIKPLKIFFFLFQTYWIVSDFSYDRNIFIIKFDLKKTDISNPFSASEKGLLRIYSLSAFEKGYDPLFVHTIPKMFLLSLGQNVEMILSLQKQADVGQNTLNAVGSVLFKSNFNQFLIVLPCEPL